jgi:hypothetical protein
MTAAERAEALELLTAPDLISRITAGLAAGRLTECDPATGEVITTMDSSELPGGYIEIPCGNRREAICPPCARLYRGDTYQVLAAGLRGGHGIPRDRRQPPRRVRHVNRAVFRAGAPTPRQARTRPGAGHAATARPASMSWPCRAGSATTTATPRSASRCAGSASITPPPFSSTPPSLPCGTR